MNPTIKLLPKQVEAIQAWSDNAVTDVAYGGAKGGGKTHLGCACIFGDALMYPETFYYIARKELNDLRKFTVPSVYETFTKTFKLDHTKYLKFNGQDNFFTILSNQSRVYLLDCKTTPADPLFERFGSNQFTKGWIEEAAEIEEEAKANLNLSVGRWKNKDYGITGTTLYTCNPKKGWLYKDFYLPNKNGTLPKSHKFIQAFCWENPYIPASYIENLKNTKNKARRERLYLGNWEYDDDPDALCNYDSIQAIFNNTHVEKTGKKYLTCDVARFGSDKARIGVWDGWVLIEQLCFDISATTQIQSAIKAMRTKHQIAKVNSIADEDGVGGGVVDNCDIQGFLNGSSPLKDPREPITENYMNLQTQCIYKLADKINTFGIYIECELSETDREEIEEEIEWMKSYKNDDDGKLRALPKKIIKEKIGRSPDWRDLFLMRYYFELVPERHFFVI